MDGAEKENNTQKKKKKKKSFKPVNQLKTWRSTIDFETRL